MDALMLTKPGVYQPKQESLRALAIGPWKSHGPCLYFIEERTRHRGDSRLVAWTVGDTAAADPKSLDFSLGR